MDEKGISYEMLADLLRAERRSNKLSAVQPRFWSTVRDFLATVTATFRAEQEKDPFSRKAMMLRDEAQHASQAAQGLWALRERKMALYALAQAKEGGAKKPEGITRVEEEVYDALMQALRDGRRTILDMQPSPTPPPSATPRAVAKPAGATPAGREAREAAEAAEPAEAAEADEAGAPATVVPADSPSDEAVTIRALADIPPFVGPDMQTYLLKQGDIASVPPAIAKLLERRQKAAIVTPA